MLEAQIHAKESLEGLQRAMWGTESCLNQLPVGHAATVMAKSHANLTTSTRASLAVEP